MNPEVGTDGSDLSISEIHDRTASGVAFITVSGFAGLAVAFLGNLLLARMLTPRDFGLVAIGATVATFGTAFAEGGLGTGMIRSASPPSRADLRALNGLQLALALAICLPCALAALEFGVAGEVTAIMILSLPIETLQTPATVELTRSMRYDRLSLMTLGSLTAGQLFAVVSVALGAGVWGLAIAAVVRSVAGTVLIPIVGARLNLPSVHGWRRLGPTMKFGLRFQSNYIVTMIGDQLLNVTVGAVAGLDVLGIWSLAKKTLQVPSVLFGSLLNVAFPAISNLEARGQDTAARVVQTVRLATVVASLIFVPFAVACPALISAMFGSKWHDAAEAVPLCLFAALISGPTSSVLSGYLFARGRTWPVIAASGANAIVLIAIAALLLPTLGVRAVGIGALCGAVVVVAIFDRAARYLAGISPLRQMSEPLGVALLCGGVGLAVTTADPRGLVVVGGATTAFLADVALLFLLSRRDLVEALKFTLSSFRRVASALMPV